MKPRIPVTITAPLWSAVACHRSGVGVGILMLASLLPPQSGSKRPHSTSLPLWWAVGKGRHGAAARRSRDAGAAALPEPGRDRRGGALRATRRGGDRGLGGVSAVGRGRARRALADHRPRRRGGRGPHLGERCG